MTRFRPILFTAFEPSGDALAAALIAELKRRRPDRVIHALGGPQMADAGAELIETTTEHAVMLAGAVGQATAHRRRVKRLATWMRGREIAAVVPTDSPAANWAVCKLARRLQPDAKIIHLAAPQLWAWAPWRIGKLRRLTDHVLCLLPFEQQWFGSRGVESTFVGHPIFEDAPHATPLDLERPGEPRVALLPGSRPSEIRHNWPMMREAFDRLRADHPGAVAIAAVRQRSDVDLLGPRASIETIAERTDAAIAWADVVLTVSGTVTLRVAAHRKPMVIVYNVKRLTWELIGRWLVRTRTFTLPNLIGESLGIGRVCPELVPHFGHVVPVAEALEPLLAEGPARRRQREGFDRIAEAFAGRRFSTAAADALLAIVEGDGAR